MTTKEDIRKVLAERKARMRDSVACESCWTYDIPIDAELGECPNCGETELLVSIDERFDPLVWCGGRGVNYLRAPTDLEVLSQRRASLQLQLEVVKEEIAKLEAEEEVCCG